LTIIAGDAGGLTWRAYAPTDSYDRATATNASKASYTLIMKASHGFTDAARGSRKRVPDFFVVGHMKSGTTALYGMLRHHPQIFMDSGKEPWFLASELRERAALRPAGTGRTPETLEEYLSLFEGARPGQRVGEASALYLWSRTAAKAIADLQPAARIIAVLREPAGFLRSLHLQFVQTYLDPEKDFRKALSLENARRQGRSLARNEYWPGATLYSEHVRYVEQLQRYKRLFPENQMLVLIYDDFRRDNEATVRAIWRFLGVDDAAPIHVSEANPTVRVRGRHLYELVHRVAVGRSPLSRAVNVTAKALAPAQLSRETAVGIRDRLFFDKPEPPDEALMLELRRRFKPEVEALSEHLGRDLVTLWGYDRVG
jgi:Sulfotransferase domain